MSTLITAILMVIGHPLSLPPAPGRPYAGTAKGLPVLETPGRARARGGGGRKEAEAPWPRIAAVPPRDKLPVPDKETGNAEVMCRVAFGGLLLIATTWIFGDILHWNWPVAALAGTLVARPLVERWRRSGLYRPAIRFTFEFQLFRHASETDAAAPDHPSPQGRRCPP